VTASTRRIPPRSAATRLVANLSMSMLAATSVAASPWASASPAASTRKPAAEADLPGIARSFHPGPPEDRTIYRCGTRYSPVPCADAKPLAVADPRTEEQRLQGQDVAARQRRMAAWLEAERHERDKLVPAAASAPKSKAGRRPKKNCVPTSRTACIASPPQPRTVILKAPSTKAAASATLK